MGITSIIQHLRSSHLRVKDRDVLLCSFPKSGNTWVRFLVANVYNQRLQLFKQIDFHNIHDLVPEFPTRPRYELTHLPVILKTHLPHRSDFHKVILILRNPLDVMYSYFRYLEGEKKLSTSLTEVIHHPRWGIDALIQHTNSFVKRCESLLILTYERLYTDPEAQLDRILAFLDVSASSDLVRKAVECSTFDAMRRIEIERGRHYGSKDFLFTRRGSVGEGATHLSAEDIARIDRNLIQCPVLSVLYSGVYR